MYLLPHGLGACGFLPQLQEAANAPKSDRTRKNPGEWPVEWEFIARFLWSDLPTLDIEWVSAHDLYQILQGDVYSPKG